MYRSVARAFLASLLLAASIAVPASAAGPVYFAKEYYYHGPVIYSINTAWGMAFDGEVWSLGGYGAVGFTHPKLGALRSNGMVAGTDGPLSNGLVAESLSTDGAHPGSGLVALSYNGNGLFAQSYQPGFSAGAFLNQTGASANALRATATGNGVVASSVNLNGVVGQTSFNSGLSGTGQAGLYGMDLSTDGGISNAGVAGTSVSGFGISGTATGEGTGVAGFAADGVGIYGFSNNNLALFGDSVNSVGLEGYSESDVGMIADTQATPDPSDGVNGPAALYVSTDAGSPAIKVSGNGGDIMSLDASGNLIVSGNLTVDGTVTSGSSTTPLAVPQRTRNPHVMIGAYTSVEAERSIEDDGEGQLRGGQAFVRLDLMFSAAIDPRHTYLVFLTPQGESRELYVAQKTPYGFAVREQGNGHSNVAFDYRIVAKPVGPQSPRLPAIVSRRATGNGRPLSTPARLRRFARFPFRRPRIKPRYRAGFMPRIRVRPEDKPVTASSLHP